MADQLREGLKGLSPVGSRRRGLASSWRGWEDAINVLISELRAAVQASELQSRLLSADGDSLEALRKRVSNAIQSTDDARSCRRIFDKASVSAIRGQTKTLPFEGLVALVRDDPEARRLLRVEAHTGRNARHGAEKVFQQLRREPWQNLTWDDFVDAVCPPPSPAKSAATVPVSAANSVATLPLNISQLGALAGSQAPPPSVLGADAFQAEFRATLMKLISEDDESEGESRGDSRFDGATPMSVPRPQGKLAAFAARRGSCQTLGASRASMVRPWLGATRTMNMTLLAGQTRLGASLDCTRGGVSADTSLRRAAPRTRDMPTAAVAGLMQDALMRRAGMSPRHKRAPVSPFGQGAEKSTSVGLSDGELQRMIEDHLSRLGDLVAIKEAREFNKAHTDLPRLGSSSLEKDAGSIAGLGRTTDRFGRTTGFGRTTDLSRTTGAGASTDTREGSADLQGLPVAESEPDVDGLGSTSRSGSSQGAVGKQFQAMKSGLISMAVFAGLLLLGAVFYTQVEDWSWLDAFYFSVVTVTTVGYGDLSPSKAGSKVFTIFFIISGLAAVAFATMMLGQALVDRQMSGMLNQITGLQGKKVPPDPVSAYFSKISWDLITTIAILVIGVGAMGSLEDFSFIDSLYFCVVTSTTVGYGDISPKTEGGKKFSIFWAFFSTMSVARLLGSIVEGYIEYQNNTLALEVLSEAVVDEEEWSNLRDHLGNEAGEAVAETCADLVLRGCCAENGGLEGTLQRLGLSGFGSTPVAAEGEGDLQMASESLLSNRILRRLGAAGLGDPRSNAPYP
eukprot:Hpha_TRINITY_DN15711_c1_g14::TRINITY_DN15711_c1_g14_i1::g.39150::m.39150